MGQKRRLKQARIRVWSTAYSRHHDNFRPVRLRAKRRHSPLGVLL